MNPGALISTAALVVSVFSSLMYLAYQVGRLSVRVEHLEDWRGEMREFEDRMDERFEGLRNLIHPVR